LDIPPSQKSRTSVSFRLNNDVESLETREKEFAIRFNNQFTGYNYISGYVNGEFPVVVKCLTCDQEFNRSANVVRSKDKINCPHCKEAQMEFKGELARKRQEQERNERQQLKKYRGIQREMDRVWILLNRPIYEKTCPSCTKEFGTFKETRKYCSEDCLRKEQNRRRDLKRRGRIERNGAPDKDITLGRLMGRDGHICYLCGYRTNEGLHYNANKYPTIEHVIPLSLGGSHTWRNVKVACRQCNTIKRDNLYVAL